ncbi:MAG: retroviral-like aspartic protease family protein [Aridibacter sp.]
MKRKPLFISAVCVLILACACISLAQGKRVKIAEASFDFHKNLIFLKVKINGKGPFNVMLDTGTNPSAIDSATARELGLKLKATGEKAAGGGTSANAVYDVEPVSVAVGKLKAKNIEISAVDLSAIGKAIGKPLHGILGHSFLNNRVVQIDYPKRLVRFYSKPAGRTPSKHSSAANQTTLPFRYANESILIEDVQVNGKKVTTLFDTGLNGVFAVMPSALSALDLEEEFNVAKPAKSVGFSGASTSRIGTVKTVKIGILSVDSAAVVFWERNTGHDTTSYGFTIGNGFLKGFIVTVDYRNSVITLEKPRA